MQMALAAERLPHVLRAQAEICLVVRGRRGRRGRLARMARMARRLGNSYLKDKGFTTSIIITIPSNVNVQVERRGHSGSHLQEGQSEKSDRQPKLHMTRILQYLQC